MWKGGMKIEQIEILENTFAIFTEDGWMTPLWVLSLRDKINIYQETPNGNTDA